MKKVGYVNRTWTPDSYFSLCKPIYRGAEENVQGECPDTAIWGRRFPVLSSGAEYPSYATASSRFSIMRRIATFSSFFSHEHRSEFRIRRSVTSHLHLRKTQQSAVSSQCMIRFQGLILRGILLSLLGQEVVRRGHPSAGFWVLQP